MSSGNGLCEYNLFVNCAGEREMLSIKSSDNVIRYNTLKNSSGAELCIRHGNRNQVYGNYLTGTQGMRVYGKDNVFHSNQLIGNTIGFTFGNSDVDMPGQAPYETDATKLKSHDKPDRTTVAFNTFVNNTTHLHRESNYNVYGTTNSRLANNIFQGGSTLTTKDGSAAYTFEQCAGNIHSGVSSTGSGWTAVSGGFASVNPLLTLDASGIYRLQAGSPAIDTAVATPADSLCAQDWEGQLRSSPKDKGADEVSAAATASRVLTTADVGMMADLNVTPTASAPTFSPAGGTFSTTQSVTLASATSGATIRYTLDGSTPTSSSTVYISALVVSSTTTIKAIASASGHNDSPVSSATFTINTGPAPVTLISENFNPPPGRSAPPRARPQKCRPTQHPPTRACASPTPPPPAAHRSPARLPRKPAATSPWS
jgi:hypothetical protein